MKHEVTVSKWDELTIGDLRMIEELAAHSSLRSWSRLHGTNAVHAARRLNQIEDRIGKKLTRRSNQGISLTREGERLARSVNQIHHAIAKLESSITLNGPEMYARNIVVGARGFITAFFAGSLVQSLNESDLCLQLIELSPSESVEAASRSAIDIAISLEPLELGKDWHRKLLGKFYWKIYGRTAHPLGQEATPAGLRSFRLAHQSYWNGKNVVSNQGDVHQILELSHAGFGSQSAVTAIEIAAHSDQIVCVPEVAARRAVSAGQIMEIKTKGLKLPETEVYVYLTGSISRRVALSLVDAMKRQLENP
jgi:DNA-binding transcriptional LysR family regulator